MGPVYPADAGPRRPRRPGESRSSKRGKVARAAAARAGGGASRVDAGPRGCFYSSMSAHERPDAPAGGPSDRQPGLPQIDVNEYGGKRQGERQVLNKRLFMQLLVFNAPAGTSGDELAARTA